jgi:hypothetical protein
METRRCQETIMLDGHEHHAPTATGNYAPPARPTEDPFLTAIRKAPLCSPSDRERYLALRAEVADDTNEGESGDSFMAWLATLPRGSAG